MTAQLSIQLITFAERPDGWDRLFAVAEMADRCGIDRVVVSEHVVMGEELEAYGDPRSGGTAGGRQPTSPDGHWLDALTVLSMLAARTGRVRLGTAILLAALREPALLAKQLATLDVLSGGRLDLGVGVGWQREEYAACGLDFAARGDRLDDCLHWCQQFWTESAVTGGFGHSMFDRVHSMPKPVQPGGVPIWISGRANARTAARVARFGTGWIPWGDDIADPSRGIALIRAAMADVGRDPMSLQVQGVLPVVAGDVAATVQAAAPLHELGVTDFRVYARWGVDPAADEAYLGDLVPAFHDALD